MRRSQWKTNWMTIWVRYRAQTTSHRDDVDVGGARSCDRRRELLLPRIPTSIRHAVILPSPSFKSSFYLSFYSLKIYDASRLDTYYVCGPLFHRRSTVFLCY